MVKKSVLLILFLIAAFNLSKIQAEVVFKLDFSHSIGSVKEWFQDRGWKYVHNFHDMHPRFKGGKLVIEAKDDDFGAVAKKFDVGNELKNVKKIRILWGVNQYPSGVVWSGPKNKPRNPREAIAVIISFGTKKLPSGSIFRPDQPYFIGLFLHNNAKPAYPYFGNYYQEGGRYYCIPCDGSVNRDIITEVDITELFEQTFGLEAPPITALAIETDVTETKQKNHIHSKAYIKRIEMFE